MSLPWKKINNIPRIGEGEFCVRGLLGVVSRMQKLIPSPHPSIYPNLSITASLQTDDRNSWSPQGLKNRGDCIRRDNKMGMLWRADRRGSSVFCLFYFV